MRRAFTLLALSAAVLLADAGTADAQFRSRGGRGTAVISVGLGNGVLSYGQSSYGGQSYYGNGYNGVQSYSPFGNVYGNQYGTVYGNQYGYPSNGYAHNQMYYSTPNYYGGQHSGYYGQTYSPYSQAQHYQLSPGGSLVPAGYYHHR